MKSEHHRRRPRPAPAAIPELQRSRVMTHKPKTIDDYLASLNGDKRAALERLRKVIRATAPKAEECISYGLPAFRLNGRPLVALGAAANHCAFYPMSGSTVGGLKAGAKGLRHQQRHHPLSNRQATANRPGAEAGQGSDRGERATLWIR